MTEECNCLPLKYILNSSTENLLEHFVFVQVITKLDQNDTCLGRLLNISEALEPVVSHIGIQCNSCLSAFMYGHCLLAWVEVVHIMLKIL